MTGGRESSTGYTAGSRRRQLTSRGTRRDVATASAVLTALKHARNPAKAAFQQGFFRTAPGEYGEGDRFLGLTVPEQRTIARRFRALPLPEIARLLANPFHEARFVGTILLVERFRKASDGERDVLAAFYLDHLDAINNWDLVDVSAPQILGEHLADRRDARPLYAMATSERLWDRRIAMLASWAFMKRGDTRPTVRLARQLLRDPHDLMHKAVGWMLRELGKVDEAALLAFLDKHARAMPRTMLRYATERLTDSTRRRYITLRGVR